MYPLPATFFVLCASILSAAAADGFTRRVIPSGWASGYLEDYQTYHTRYLSIGCRGKQDTPFFDECCHPLLATESLEKDRPARCSPLPSNISSADSSDLPFCDELDDDEVAHPVNKNTIPRTLATDLGETLAKGTEEDIEGSSTPSAESKGPFSGGFATFYYQDGVPGACGKVHKDSEYIAAIDERRYGNPSQRSQLCGRKVKVTNPRNGKSVTVTIADDCPTCVNKNSIDLSLGAFKAIATEREGMVGVKWSFA